MKIKVILTYCFFLIFGGLLGFYFTSREPSAKIVNSEMIEDSSTLVKKDVINRDVMCLNEAMISAIYPHIILESELRGCNVEQMKNVKQAIQALVRGENKIAIKYLDEYRYINDPKIEKPEKPAIGTLAFLLDALSFQLKIDEDLFNHDKSIVLYSNNLLEPFSNVYPEAEYYATKAILHSTKEKNSVICKIAERHYEKYKKAKGKAKIDMSECKEYL